MNCKTLKSFTMAEILISLTIIGVIAAVTLPSLRANINEKAWATQRKALYSRMSQAISMLPSLNGYGIGATEEETAQKATEAFITNGLGKVLKIKNICDSENMKKCGFPDAINVVRQNYITENKINTPKKLNDLNNQFTPFTIDQTEYNYSQIDTQSAAFETLNGESILTFYNPNCSYNMASVAGRYLAQPTMCANFVYDLNGHKGPNQVGKDIGFITAFYPTDSIVATAIPSKSINSSIFKNYLSLSEAKAACKTMNKNVKLPNLEEFEVMWVNLKLSSLQNNAHVTSTSKDGRYYVFGAYAGNVLLTNPIGKSYSVQCIEK